MRAAQRGTEDGLTPTEQLVAVGRFQAIIYFKLFLILTLLYISDTMGVICIRITSIYLLRYYMEVSEIQFPEFPAGTEVSINKSFQRVQKLPSTKAFQQMYRRFENFQDLHQQ